MKADTFANNVDPDEVACNELYYQAIYCLPFFKFWLRPLLRTMVLSRFIDGRVHLETMVEGFSSVVYL